MVGISGVMVGIGVGVGLEVGAGVHAPRISNAVMSKTAIIRVLCIVENFYSHSMVDGGLEVIS